MSIATPYDAEVNAATQMRVMGFVDATVTAPGADGGIDVDAVNAVAQVKLHGKPTGRPDLQRLYGARGGSHAKVMLFFTLAGYSAAAVEYANQVGMALFTYSLDGTVSACNDHALGLLNQSQDRLRAAEELDRAQAELRAAEKSLKADRAAAAAAEKRRRFTARTGYRADSYDDVIGMRCALILSGAVGYGALLVGLTGMVMGSGFWQRVFAGGLVAFAILMFGTKQHSRRELEKYRIDGCEVRVDRRGVLKLHITVGVLAGLLVVSGCISAVLNAVAALNDRIFGVVLAGLEIHLLHLAWSSALELRSLPKQAQWRNELNGNPVDRIPRWLST
ncbi:hypothetical protein ABH922_005197 [Rhodococcus sp. 27YEA15]|uniref:restriction endonuclease n=1 Tax=Rhodococcus sp. 27YEA15 TaxID=3156259 RepID=UPI003C7E2F74